MVRGSGLLRLGAKGNAGLTVDSLKLRYWVAHQVVVQHIHEAVGVRLAARRLGALDHPASLRCPVAGDRFGIDPVAEHPPSVGHHAEERG